jgi:hypothetical protein
MEDDMDLRRLRYFIAVAEEGSLTLAAEFERAVVLEIGNPGRSNVRLPT